MCMLCFALLYLPQISTFAVDSYSRCRAGVSMSSITLLFLNSTFNLEDCETNSTRCRGHIEKCQSKSQLSKEVTFDCESVLCVDWGIKTGFSDKRSFLNLAVHFSACIFFTGTMIPGSGSHKGNRPLSSTLS